MLSIQPADTSAIPLIRKLAYAVWPAAYSSILSADQLRYMLELIYSEEALARQIEEGQQFYFAYNNNQPVGFVAFGRYDSTTYKLYKIYVLPETQGKGTGRQLLNFVINKVKENRADFLILNVNRRNPAYYFYEKMGFKTDEIVDIDIGNGYFMNDFAMKLAVGNV